MTSKCPASQTTATVSSTILSTATMTSLTDTPIRIEHHSYPTHRPRFIQPLYGPEVAVNGVGDAQSAKSMIDSYIQLRYGDASGEAVVRRSRTELDGSTALSSPHSKSPNLSFATPSTSLNTGASSVPFPVPTPPQFSWHPPHFLQSPALLNHRRPVVPTPDG